MQDIDGFNCLELMYDEKKLAGYIELQLKNGMSLSNIKKGLKKRGFPSFVLDNALRIAFSEKMRQIQAENSDVRKPSMRLGIIIDIIPNIITIACIVIAVIVLMDLI